MRGHLAQWLEHLAYTEGVGGSKPSVPSGQTRKLLAQPEVLLDVQRLGAHGAVQAQVGELLAVALDRQAGMAQPLDAGGHGCGLVVLVRLNDAVGTEGLEPPTPSV